MEEAGLFVKNTVDGGMMLKRLRPAPQVMHTEIEKTFKSLTISEYYKGQKTNPIGNRLERYHQRMGLKLVWWK
jgi:large subunit ribosomal protein L22